MGNFSQTMIDGIMATSSRLHTILNLERIYLLINTNWKSGYYNVNYTCRLLPNNISIVNKIKKELRIKAAFFHSKYSKIVEKFNLGWI